jgi:hypothetical protein
MNQMSLIRVDGRADLSGRNGAPPSQIDQRIGGMHCPAPPISRTNCAAFLYSVVAVAIPGLLPRSLRAPWACFAGAVSSNDGRRGHDHA